MFFILEADKSTETITTKFLKKMAAYYHFYTQDKFKDWSVKNHIQPQNKPVPLLRVITYTTTPARQYNLIQAALQVNQDQLGSKMFWFTNQTLLNPEQPQTIFNKIFSIARVDELDQLHSILE